MKLMKALLCPVKLGFRRFAYVVSVLFTGDIPALARAQEDSVIVRQKNLYIEQLKDMLDDSRKHIKSLSEQVDITNGWALAGRGVSFAEDFIRHKFMSGTPTTNKVFEDLKTLINNADISLLKAKFNDDNARGQLINRAKKEGVTDEQLAELTLIATNRIKQEGQSNYG